MLYLIPYNLPNSRTSSDDKPTDEERKSVRFDLQRVAIQMSVTKFNGSDEDETEESDPDDQQGACGGSSSTSAARHAAAVLSLQQVLNRQGGANFEAVKKVDIEPRSSKVIGRRFVVENVSEKDHLEQQECRSLDNDDEIPPPSKFENVKNIDLVLKSDSEKSTPRSSDSRASFLDELRKNKEIMLDKMRKSEQRSKETEARLVTQSPWSSKMLRTLELSREGSKSPNSDSPSFALELTKASMLKDHEQELRALKQELDTRLEKMKKELEDEFNDQKLSLKASMQERLGELKKEMASKEEQEIQSLVAEMDELRAEKLKKVRSELEVCYEKERQDILTNLKSELDQRKRELLELRSQELAKLENEHERELDGDKQAKLGELEVTKQYAEKTENLRKELEKEFDTLRTELRTQQREKITKITEDHEKCLADILRDFRIDVSAIM